MKKLVYIQYKIKGSDVIIKEKIKSLGSWMNYFDNTWLVHTSYDVKTIFNHINTNDKEDFFLILDVSLKDYWGIMQKEVWDWLKDKK